MTGFGVQPFGTTPFGGTSITLPPVTLPTIIPAVRRDGGPALRWLSVRGLASLAHSRDQLSRVDVLHDGEIVARFGDADFEPTFGPDGFTSALGGTVSVDRAVIRRSGSAQFLNARAALLPSEVDDLFAPLQAEIRLWSGIRYWDATPAERAAQVDIEWIPVATLVVTEVSGDWPAVTVSGFDRAWFLGQLEAPWSIVKGTNVRDAILELLGRHVPAARLETNIPTTDATTGALLYEEQTAAGDILTDLGIAAGWAVYADPMGVMVAVDEPTTDDDPVLTYEPGALSMMMRPQRAVSAADAVNVVVTKGSASDLARPVRGYAEDDDPESLTYVKRVGRRPMFQDSPLYRTTQQADLAARTLLRRHAGLADTLVVPVVPNPALESGDVLRVVDPDQGIDLTAIADAFGVPLRAADGVQSIQCRPRVLR